MDTDEKLHAIALRLAEYFSPDAPVDIPALLFVAGLQVFGRPAARPFEQGVVLSVGRRTQRIDAPGGVHPPENVFEDQGIRCLGAESGKDAQESCKESSHKVKILHDEKLGKNGQ